MKNNIYDQKIEEKRVEEKLIREVRTILEGNTDDRKRRLEQSTKNREGLESIERKTSVKRPKVSKSNMKFSNRGKTALKRGGTAVVALVGALAIVVTGKKAVMGVVEQKKIDKSMTDDYNEYIQNISEKEDTIFTKKGLEGTKEFYQAIETYNTTKNLTERVKAKAVIVEYMDNGYFQKTARVAIDKKIEAAVLYGDYVKDNNQPTEVTYISRNKEEADMLRIKGIDAKYYSMKDIDIFSKDIPDNLKDLAKDIFELQDKTWKSEDECVNVAMSMSEDLGKVVQENYLIDKKGNIKRVTDKDFEKAKNDKRYNDSKIINVENKDEIIR